MHDEAIFAPGYSTPFQRIASWRWVRWPDSETTPFSPRYVFDPHEIHVLWIDEEMRAQTHDARRAGETFPEVNRVFVPVERQRPAEPQNPAREAEEP
jgi:microcin C transport system substrate-binding protein